MTQLHLEVRKRIEMLFPREEWDEVVTILLEDVGAIMRDQGQSHERIQMAVLKLSDGDREELKRVVKIDLASDWRDILLFAGFAHDIEEHWRWNPLGPGLAQNTAGIDGDLFVAYTFSVRSARRRRCSPPSSMSC